MQRTSLGPGPLEISRILFGTARIEAAADPERIRVVHAALDAGMTSLDTAPLYEFGEIESLLGRALRGRRESVEILSKVGLRWDGDHGDVLFEEKDGAGRHRTVRRDSRPQSIRRDVEESLTRLATDRIDLCQIHQPDRLVPIEDSLGELARLAEEGKIRAIGVSNFSASELRGAMSHRNPSTGAPWVVSHQIQYNLLERSPERDVFPLARENKLGVLAYSPLAAGVLAGKLLGQGATPNAAEDFRFQTPAFHPSNAARIHAALREAVEPVANRLGVHLASISLAWLLAQPDVSGVIAGASSEPQAVALAAASEVRLTPEEIQAIGQRFAQVRIDRSAGQSLPRRARALVGRLRNKIGRRLARD